MVAWSQAVTTDDPRADRFDKCSVLLFEREADFRRHTCEFLNDLGFRKIADTGDFGSFRTAFAQGGYDLVIGDVGTERFNVCELVRHVRHNVIGRDPFLGVILTTSHPSDENVRQAVNSGTDHLIAKPYAPTQVLERIRTIVDHRKPFVVTLNYIGPDRRSGPARPTPPPELVTVPNSLRAKVRDDPTALATPETVRAAMGHINRLKVQRFDLEVGVLIELLRADGDIVDANRQSARFGRLLDLLESLKNVLPMTEYAGAHQMCVTLAGVIGALAGQESRPSKTDMRRLEETSMALHLCFHPEKTVSAINREIADAIARATETRRARVV